MYIFIHFHTSFSADCLASHYECTGPKSATDKDKCYFIQSKPINSGLLKGFYISGGSRCKGDRCFQFVIFLRLFSVLIVVCRKGFFNCGVSFIKPWHLEDKNGFILMDAEKTQ